MRRALETTYYIFREHKNFKNGKLKIIVNPDLREKLHVSVDIPTRNIHGLIKEFEEKMKYNLDISRFDNLKNLDYWYLESMDADSKGLILKEMEETGESIEEACINLIEKMYPLTLESINSVYQRVLRVREDLKSYIQ